MLLKLAIRNTFRNLRRTLITMAAISFGLALMIVSNNLTFGSYQAMISTGISTMAGHVVVQGEGWQAERDSRLVVQNATATAATLTAAFPDATIVRRSVLQGLLMSPVNSVGVMLTAIDPAIEPQVSDWQDKVVEGEYLTDDRGILIGSLLAESLQVGLGDKVVLMAQGEGETSSRLFRVRGLIHTGAKNIDGFIGIITLPAAQEVLALPDAVNQISIHLNNPDDTAQATALAKSALSGVSDIEVLAWPEALPEMHSMIQIDRASNNTIMAIIGLIVALGVLNTVLMSVMERIREFGVMLAVGTSPRRLVTIIMLEGLVLGVVSIALGIGIGMLASWPLIVHGIDYSEMMGEAMTTGGVTLSAVVHAAPDWERLIIYSVIGLVLVVLTAIYPAWRASRLKPVESMRHI
ncbi:MAG: ABC-type lipoprotein release transport system permease subunit [Myxococcota bacterium]|jgi:ABC-type lipoprotein release transport system permease subunit